MPHILPKLLLLQLLLLPAFFYLLMPPRLNPRIAFLLCDIQEKFRPAIHHFPAVVSVANRMVQASKILDVPLIVTEQNPKGLGSTVSELDVNIAKGTFEKKLFSMWIPPVQETLQREQITSVVLFGIEAHVCVLQTALDLLEHQYDVTVLMDGTSSRHRFEVDLAMRRLEKAGAILSSSESLLFQILKTAEHPKFKEISKLVKETDSQIWSVLEDKAAL